VLNPLDWLADLLLGILCAIIAGLVYALNFVIEGLGALIALMVGLLPDMPTLPALPSQVTTVLGWINWFFPVETVVTFLTFMVTAWLIWQGVAIGLRWAKAIRE
jgi:hypothetical protein